MPKGGQWVTRISILSGKEFQTTSSSFLGYLNDPFEYFGVNGEPNIVIP
jgi:hypothetical protein